MVSDRTDQIFVAAVDGEVTQGDGHGSDHLVSIRTQQLHQDGKTLLLPHCGTDIVGPLGTERGGNMEDKDEMSEERILPANT